MIRKLIQLLPLLRYRRLQIRFENILTPHFTNRSLRPLRLQRVLRGDQLPRLSNKLPWLNFLIRYQACHRPGLNRDTALRSVLWKQFFVQKAKHAFIAEQQLDYFSLIGGRELFKLVLLGDVFHGLVVCDCTAFHDVLSDFFNALKEEFFKVVFVLAKQDFFSFEFD